MLTESDIRCQPHRLGRSIPLSHGSRNLVLNSSKVPHQHFWAQSKSYGYVSLDPPSSGSSNQKVAFTENHCPAFSTDHILGRDSWQADFLQCYCLDHSSHMPFFNVDPSFGKVEEEKKKFVIALNWPPRTWYTAILVLLGDDPWPFLNGSDLPSQGPWQQWL